MTIHAHPEMAVHADDPANDNERASDQRNGPCMLTAAGLAALAVLAIAGLSPLWLLAVL